MADNYLLDDVEFSDSNLGVGVSPDDLFTMLEALEGSPHESSGELHPWTSLDGTVFSQSHDSITRLVSQKSTSSTERTSALDYSENEENASLSPCSKKQKLSQDGKQRMVHIRVERNRRKQMNEHLSALRTLMPCFYVKRGDQASIIGGVVDYIKELQQVLRSLEAKKQRKVYSDVLSPRVVSSPRPSPLSPRKPPLSPRVSLPVSPRTPQQSSPYKPRIQGSYLSPTISSSQEPSISSSSMENVKELAAKSKSSMAEVEVKYSGSNLMLRTVSPRIPGHALKIISTLEGHSLEILHISINTVDDAMIISFTIKIGIECKLSAEELALVVQQTFC